MTNEVVQSIEDLFAEFEAWIKRFRSHPAVQAAASSPAVAPSNPTPTAPAAVPVTDPHNVVFWHQWVGQSDRVAFTEAAMKLGRALTKEEMDVAYLAGVVHSEEAQPAAGGGTLPPGPVLDSFGVPKVGNYTPSYVWQIAAVAEKMHFDISSYPGQVASLATVTIKDAAGNVVVGPVEANPNQWSSPSFAGTPGMTAEVVMDKPGPGIATTYADD